VLYIIGISILTEREKATFSAGVQVAVLSLMHDILDPEPELRPGERDSLYSMGILLGILAVALDLIVALIAAANVAIASHLSLRSPRKKSNFESHFKWHLIFCMVVRSFTLFTLPQHQHCLRLWCWIFVRLWFLVFGALRVPIVWLQSVEAHVQGATLRFITRIIDVGCHP